MAHPAPALFAFLGTRLRLIRDSNKPLERTAIAGAGALGRRARPPAATSTKASLGLAVLVA